MHALPQEIDLDSSFANDLLDAGWRGAAGHIMNRQHRREAQEGIEILIESRIDLP
jgi:hypothetical protein